MNSYYCIVNLAGAPCRDIAVFSGAGDAEARLEMLRIAGNWPGFETIALYEGERPVSVLANPSLGFAREPLTPWCEAA